MKSRKDQGSTYATPKWQLYHNRENSRIRERIAGEVLQVLEAVARADQTPPQFSTQGDDENAGLVPRGVVLRPTHSDEQIHKK